MMTGKDFDFSSNDLGEKIRNKPRKVGRVEPGTCLYYCQKTGRCNIQGRCKSKVYTAEGPQKYILCGVQGQIERGVVI